MAILRNPGNGAVCACAAMGGAILAPSVRADLEPPVDPALVAGMGFSDQTAAAGVACSHGMQYPGAPFVGYFMIAGGTAGDFNGDGWQDLFVVSGGHAPDRLFINNADGTFTDMAGAWQVDAVHLGSGASIGDYDNDGDLDLFVTSFGPSNIARAPGHHKLYRNNGDATFTNVATEAGVAFTSAVIPDGFGSSFGDYDLDGDLDLAVAGWFDSSGGNRLFRNNGDGTFSDVTAALIITPLIGVHGFSPVFADMNGDRYPELLWVADYMTSRYLFNANGQAFINVTASSGTGLDSNGMGTTIADLNGDGRPDWYVTSIHDGSNPYASGNMLYANDGGNHFTEVSHVLDVNDGGWGWGTVAVDLDNNGLVDIVETNGWAGTPWDNERCKGFLNTGPGNAFVNIAAACEMQHTGQGRGLVNFDYDNDGDQDFVFFTHNGPMMLLRNDLSRPGEANWLRIDLDTSGASGLAPHGLGTHLVATIDGTERHAWANSPCNYLSHSELPVHFGAGQFAFIDELRLAWADGSTDVLINVPVNRTIRAVPGGRIGDVDDNGVVDALDFLAVLASWGRCSGCPADVVVDDVVDTEDFLTVLSDWD